MPWLSPVYTHTQLATLLNAAGKAGEQLQVLAAPADLEGPLKGLDMVLSNVTKGIASDLEAALKSLAPPEAVVQGLVRPLAANLDKGLGDLLKGVNNTANKGLPGLLNGTAGTAAVRLSCSTAPHMHAGFRLHQVESSPAVKGVLWQQRFACCQTVQTHECRST